MTKDKSKEGCGEGKEVVRLSVNIFNKRTDITLTFKRVPMYLHVKRIRIEQEDCCHVL